MNRYDTPLKIVQWLASGEAYSGEQLGKLLGMSRVAVFKHIQTLRGWGIDVCAVSGRGYRLLSPLKLLNKAQLQAALPAHSIHLMPIIGSTNQYLLDRIADLSPGELCLSEYQTAGRGRRGRRWFSPFGVNFYYSMYWRLKPSANVMGLSLVIGIVVAELLRDQGAANVKVKWPNDIYIDGKKLAGILVELCGGHRDGMHVVMGIGINLAMTQADQEMVTQAWSSLADFDIDRNTLVIALTQRLIEAIVQFEASGLAPFLSRWFALDYFLDHPVKLFVGDEVIRGISRGINEKGELLLEQAGQLSSFMSGDISLRGDE